jgi:hypothetical protein
MRLEINEGENFIRIDDGIKVQYSIYTVLLLFIFSSQAYNMISRFRIDFEFLHVIWAIALLGAVAILYYMWVMTVRRSTIKLDEIKYVRVKKYFSGTQVRIKLSSGKIRELSFLLSEREKEIFLKGLKEIGVKIL